jgi:hypothetical protein
MGSSLSVAAVSSNGRPKSASHQLAQEFSCPCGSRVDPTYFSPGGIKAGNGNAYKLDDTPTNHCFGGCWLRHSLSPTTSGGTGRWCGSRDSWIVHCLADHSTYLAGHRQSAPLAGQQFSSEPTPSSGLASGFVRKRTASDKTPGITYSASGKLQRRWGSSCNGLCPIATVIFR